MASLRWVPSSMYRSRAHYEGRLQLDCLLCVPDAAEDADMLRHAQVNFLRIFRLGQLTAQYLLHVQDSLARDAARLRVRSAAPCLAQRQKGPCKLDMARACSSPGPQSSATLEQ